MVIEAFKRCPEIEVHNESMNSRAFRGFALRDDAVIEGLIRESNHRCIAFKSLCDSHRIIHLIEGLETPRQGRAIWVLRSMEGRVRSTLAKWPENNRRVLGEIARGHGNQRWEAGGLSPDTLDFLRSFDYDGMTPESGAALLWYVRNALYFDLELSARDEVTLISYEQVLANPIVTIGSLCEFLSVSYNERMSAHIAERPPATRKQLEIDPVIQERCSELEARFAGELEERRLVPAGS
jgi:hypothetical protein